jgi:hypothetical protein
MATNEITFKLAIVSGQPKKAAQDKKESGRQKAPSPSEVPLAREIPADGQRVVADATAKDAMVMGWDRAIQKHAYENRISDHELRRILDQACDYNDKADPAGRIEELDDWKAERRGRSRLRPST